MCPSKTGWINGLPLAAARDFRAVRPVDVSVAADAAGWLDEQERSILERALQAHGYNRTAAAARLGISLRQMRYRIDRLNIQLPGEGGHGDEA